MSRYDDLIALFRRHGVPFREIEHQPEGRTEIVSAMRGNAVRDAAKCMIVMVKLGKKVTRYVLAVVPGDARVDIAAVKELLGGTYASFATAAQAESLAGSPVGTILPFAFTSELQVIADPRLSESSELFFNAACLERSVAIAASDYFRVAQPRIALIALRAPGNA